MTFFWQNPIETEDDAFRAFKSAHRDMEKAQSHVGAAIKKTEEASRVRHFGVDANKALRQLETIEMKIHRAMKKLRFER